MTKAELLAQQLNQELLNNETIKEFKKYEKLIKNNQDISDLEIKIKDLQKLIVNQKAKQEDNVEQTINDYESLKQSFDSNPLITNYLYLKEEVDLILQNVNNSINGQL